MPSLHHLLNSFFLRPLQLLHLFRRTTTKTSNLAVVERAFHANAANVGIRDRGHLLLLNQAHAPFGVQNEAVHAFLAPQTVNRGGPLENVQKVRRLLGSCAHGRNDDICSFHKSVLQENVMRSKLHSYYISATFSIFNS